MLVMSRVTGGLGNQMFQYATAWAFAHAKGASLEVDTSCYDYTHEAKRRYMLDCFAVTGRVITTDRFSRFLYKLAQSERFPRSAGTIRYALRLTDHCESQQYRFAPVVLPDTSRIRLLGYWQSYRYFEDYAAEVRKEFAFRDPPTGKNACFLDQIRSNPGAVSVHIRRGDYLKVRPQAVLPIEYYRLAIGMVTQRVAKPTFFLFSDDIAWVRRNLQLPGDVVTVDANGELAGHEDLRLMSACRHHIIANSSFSWWGAWLNPSPNKLVIAPKYWLGTAESHYPDLFPTNWQVLWPNL